MTAGATVIGPGDASVSEILFRQGIQRGPARLGGAQGIFDLRNLIAGEAFELDLFGNFSGRHAWFGHWRRGILAGGHLLRIERRRKGEVPRVDVNSTFYSLAILHDRGGKVITHDGDWIALLGTHERLLGQRRQYLLVDLLGCPSLVAVVESDGPVAIDPLHDVAAHVFVLIFGSPERVMV